MQREQRVVYYDFLNVAACFAVVVLHVNSAFWSFAGDARWMENLLIESFFYPAVAIFLMLTGATLIDYRKRYATKVYCIKRMTGVVLPYVAWSLLAMGFHVLKGTLPVSELTVSNIISWLVNGSYYSVLLVLPAAVRVLSGDPRAGADP